MLVKAACYIKMNLLPNADALISDTETLGINSDLLKVKTILTKNELYLHAG